MKTAAATPLGLASLGLGILAVVAGVYYLALRPPQRSDWRAYERSLQTGPRWRIDVPVGAQAVYVGTLSLTGEADPLLFGDRIMRSIRGDASSVEDERDFAADLLAPLNLSM